MKFREASENIPIPQAKRGTPVKATEHSANIAREVEFPATGASTAFDAEWITDSQVLKMKERRGREALAKKRLSLKIHTSSGNMRTRSQLRIHTRWRERAGRAGGRRANSIEMKYQC